MNTKTHTKDSDSINQSKLSLNPKKLDDKPLRESIFPQLLCVELKLKQGFLEKSSNGHPICKFCLKQHLKVWNIIFYK